MVSTRHHPRAFPEPASPTPRSTRGTPSKASSSPPASPTMSPITSAFQSVTSAVSNAVTPAKSPQTRTLTRRRKSTRSSSSYTHLVNPIIIFWLFLSLPLVTWDTLYVFLRPLSMPGGSLHSPIWSPYGLYGKVDYNYGWPAWNDGVGFTAAQSSLNVIETALYLWYLYTLTWQGQGTGWFKFWDKTLWTEKVVVEGEGVALATVLLFASVIMTLSKTALYFLNEYYSNYENVGHNPFWTLFWVFLVTNGLWLIFPTYITYAVGKELVSALNVAKSSGLEKED